MSEKFRYRVWIFLLFLNAALTAHALAVGDMGRVGFSGFFTILSALAVYVLSPLNDEEKQE